MTKINGREVAKEVLLFDGENTMTIKKDRLLELVAASPVKISATEHKHGFIAGIRSSGKFKDKALFLNRNYNWETGYDDSGHLLLIPTKKGR